MGGGGLTREADRAALRLLEELGRRGYDFVPVTPATHQRVVARPGMEVARDLRGIFGWSLAFDPEMLPEPVHEIMRSAGLLREEGGRCRSAVRVSRVRNLLFLHSAFPTDQPDSVFLGPDSVRFADFVRREMKGADRVRRIVDLGAGAGVGGIVAGRLAPQARVELVDVNAQALAWARVNATAAGREVVTVEGQDLAGVEPGYDLAIANPPFILDDDGPIYRSGGRMHGGETSLTWARQMAAGLGPGGRILLYTGSAIIGGRDRLGEAIEQELGAGFRIRYDEIDPDIFGEELEQPAYREVERIAAIGCVIERPQ